MGWLPWEPTKTAVQLVPSLTLYFPISLTAAAVVLSAAMARAGYPHTWMGSRRRPSWCVRLEPSDGLWVTSFDPRDRRQVSPVAMVISLRGRPTALRRCYEFAASWCRLRTLT
jgi:hypothetical protein